MGAFILPTSRFEGMNIDMNDKGSDQNEKLEVTMFGTYFMSIPIGSSSVSGSSSVEVITM